MTIEDFRGGFPAEPLTVRRIAGLLDAPGCHRRQLIDAAGIPIDVLARLLGGEGAGQSPFALARTRQFEKQVGGDGMAALLALVRERLGAPVTAVRELDLSADQVRSQYARGDSAFRAQLTRQAFARMLAEDPSAINILRHPVLMLRVGGTPTPVEPDALTFAGTDPMHSVAIRSYPCVDGVADPGQVSATARELAVQVLAARELATELGHDPGRIATRGLLVLPENFGLVPTGAVLDVAPQVRRLQRVLAGFPDTAALAALVPAGVSLPVPPDRTATDADRAEARQRAADALGEIGARFGDGCMGCALFRFCRQEQDARGAVSRIGTAAVNLCGDVGTVSAALDLAAGRRRPASEAERAVALDLARAAAALEWAS